MTLVPLEQRVNFQPVEKQDLDPRGVLDVVAVFPTIQGEGPFAGETAVFVRTAGCNLDCPVCDTSYTAGRQKYTVEELAQKVNTLRPNEWCDLVVLTGGEPLRQNVVPFVRRLLGFGLRVQVETNGTLHLGGLYDYRGLTVVCSPKTGKVHDQLKPLISALKYVVSFGKVDPSDNLPTDSLGAGVRVQRPWEGFKGQVYVQPADEGDPDKNKANLEEAVKACLKWNYKLSLQMHKIANLP